MSEQTRDSRGPYWPYEPATMREEFALDILSAPGFIDYHDWARDALGCIGEVVIATLNRDGSYDYRNEHAGQVLDQYQQMAKWVPKADLFRGVTGMLHHARLLNPAAYEAQHIHLFPGYETMYALADMTAAYIAQGRLEELREVLRRLEGWLELTEDAGDPDRTSTPEFHVWNCIAAGYVGHVCLSAPTDWPPLLALCGPRLRAQLARWAP